MQAAGDGMMYITQETWQRIGLYPHTFAFWNTIVASNPFVMQVAQSDKIVFRVVGNKGGIVLGLFDSRDTASMARQTLAGGVIFRVRDSVSSAVHPLKASHDLETLINFYVKPSDWRWDVPRWADSKLTHMSVLFTDDETAEEVLTSWNDWWDKSIP